MSELKMRLALYIKCATRAGLISHLKKRAVGDSLNPTYKQRETIKTTNATLRHPMRGERAKRAKLLLFALLMIVGQQ